MSYDWLAPTGEQDTSLVFQGQGIVELTTEHLLVKKVFGVGLPIASGIRLEIKMFLRLQ
jgi:hypothetical protein